MENRIDLDAAAEEIRVRADHWRQGGVAVGCLTWRDQSVVPPRLTTIRAEAIEADSVGLMLRSGKAEGEIVLFKGGWVDFTYWTGNPQDEAIQDAPGWDRPMTTNEFGIQLDRLYSMMLGAD